MKKSNDNMWCIIYGRNKWSPTRLAKGTDGKGINISKWNTKLGMSGTANK